MKYLVVLFFLIGAFSCTTYKQLISTYENAKERAETRVKDSIPYVTLQICNDISDTATFVLEEYNDKCEFNEMYRITLPGNSEFQQMVVRRLYYPSAIVGNDTIYDVGHTFPNKWTVQLTLTD